MSPALWAFTICHQWHDEREEDEREYERQKERWMMEFLLRYQPDAARDLLQGKVPDIIPPDETGPMDDQQFALGDRYFHLVPTNVLQMKQERTE